MARRSGDTQGDEFIRQLRACDARMRALAYSVLGSVDQMDDVLHDAYLKAFRAQARFRGDSSFATWLGAIVYRCCLDLIRAESRARARTMGTAGAGLDELADVADAEAAVDTRLDVTAALARLSPDHRAILVLVDLEGLPLAEAADVLGVPVGTVASRLARGRGALRAAMNVPAGEPASEGTR